MDRFTQGYIECAVWASTTGDDQGTPLDSIDADLSVEAITRMETDCKDFQEANRADLDQANELGRPDDYLGYDFFLTRNGHCTGFWDRGLGEVGARLTRAAKVYGSADLYLGDDGQIHHA